MVSNRPLVSVVMPAYNAEEFIASAIESILNQTLRNFELIIVDDFSNDKTSRIIKKYQEKDSRIRVITNEKNLQIANSLNKGVASAKADLIARMDADDESLPKRLELQYHYLNLHPEVAVVGANIFIIDKNGRTFSKREYPEKNIDLKKVMFRYSPFAHPVVMFRKKAFNEFNGYDTSRVPCEDVDLWFKLGSKYKFGTVPEFVLNYRIIQNSGSNSNKKLKALELLGFKIKFDAIRKYGYKPGFYDIIYNFCEFITLWFMPAPLRVWTYNFLRSNKLI